MEGEDLQQVPCPGGRSLAPQVQGRDPHPGAEVLLNKEFPTVPMWDRLFTPHTAGKKSVTVYIEVVGGISQWINLEINLYS